MNNTVFTATQAIQAILAPAVMISANGLFLLGLNARQTCVFNRIRLLNDEKRKIRRDINQSLDEHFDNLRCSSIEHQIAVLLRRAWYVRNSLMCCTIAVAFFVLSSFGIGVNFLIAGNWVNNLPLYLFILAMFLVLSGVIFLTIDEFISYYVIMIEVREK
ncbi:MAG TPA: DUF2721 domain-containing protein [Halomicronema sp.]